MEVFEIPELVHLILSYLSPHDQVMLLSSKKDLTLMFSDYLITLRHQLIKDNHIGLSQYLKRNMFISYSIASHLFQISTIYKLQRLSNHLFNTLSSIVYYLSIVFQLQLPNYSTYPTYLNTSTYPNHPHNPNSADQFNSPNNVDQASYDDQRNPYLGQNYIFRSSDRLLVYTSYSKLNSNLKKILHLYGQRIEEIREKLRFILNNRLITSCPSLFPILDHYNHFSYLVDQWSVCLRGRVSRANLINEPFGKIRI